MRAPTRWRTPKTVNPDEQATSQKLAILFDIKTG